MKGGSSCIDTLDGHSLRYMDFPRGSHSYRHQMFKAGKKHRYVCECGDLGPWSKSMQAASLSFNEHVEEMRHAART